MTDLFQEHQLLLFRIASIFNSANERYISKIRLNAEYGRISGPMRDEVIGGWRKLHNNELHNLYSSPGIIKMIESMRMGWAAHVARMGRRGVRVRF
jgi:hypothetical protein